MAGGFRPEPRVYHLIFADHPDVAGLEVKVRAMTIRERLDFDRMRLTPATTLEEGWKKEQAMAQALADRLLWWNLEYLDGKPVPITLRGVQSQEAWVINPIIREWINALIGVRTQDPTTPPDPAGEELMSSIPVQPLTPDSST